MRGLSSFKYRRFHTAHILSSPTLTTFSVTRARTTLSPFAPPFLLPTSTNPPLSSSMSAQQLLGTYSSNSSDLNPQESTTTKCSSAHIQNVSSMPLAASLSNNVSKKGPLHISPKVSLLPSLPVTTSIIKGTTSLSKCKKKEAVASCMEKNPVASSPILSGYSPAEEETVIDSPPIQKQKSHDVIPLMASSPTVSVPKDYKPEGVFIQEHKSHDKSHDSIPSVVISPPTSMSSKEALVKETAITFSNSSHPKGFGLGGKSFPPCFVPKKGDTSSPSPPLPVVSPSTSQKFTPPSPQDKFHSFSPPLTLTSSSTGSNEVKIKAPPFKNVASPLLTPKDDTSLNFMSSVSSPLQIPAYSPPLALTSSSSAGWSEEAPVSVYYSFKTITTEPTTITPSTSHDSSTDTSSKFTPPSSQEYFSLPLTFAFGSTASYRAPIFSSAPGLAPGDSSSFSTPSDSISSPSPFKLTPPLSQECHSPSSTQDSTSTDSSKCQGFCWIPKFSAAARSLPPPPDTDSLSPPSPWKLTPPSSQEEALPPPPSDTDSLSPPLPCELTPPPSQGALPPPPDADSSLPSELTPPPFQRVLPSPLDTDSLSPPSPFKLTPPPSHEELPVLSPPFNTEQILPPAQEESRPLTPPSDAEQILPPAQEESRPLTPPSDAEQILPPAQEESRPLTPPSDAEQILPPAQEESRPLTPPSDAEQILPPSQEESLPLTPPEQVLPPSQEESQPLSLQSTANSDQTTSISEGDPTSTAPSLSLEKEQKQKPQRLRRKYNSSFINIA